MKKLWNLSAAMLIFASFATSASAEPLRCRDAVIGIKATREYLTRPQKRCFRRIRNAENAGYAVFGTNPTPTPTVTPTPTPTPTPGAFSGTWSVPTPMALQSASTDCATLAITPAASRSFQIQVDHDSAAGIVRGADTSNRRSWGTAGANSFTLIDANLWQGSGCGQSPNIESTWTFTDVSGDTASVTQIDTLVCLGTYTCTMVWSGSASK